MMNEAHVSLTGYVASQPKLRSLRESVQILSMRVAWTPRWLDRATGEWTDGNTSYATVTCWRKLADNAAVCLRKGDPVVVRGRLSVRTYTDKQGVSRTQVDIDATSVGHDLCRGVAQFQRTRPATGQTAAEYAASVAAAGHDFGSEPGDPGDLDTAGLDEVAELSALGEAAQADPDSLTEREILGADAVAGLAAEPAAAAAPF